ncbi:MAG: hypothetical protein AAGC58_13875 [Asticcacaulis sp.]
MSSVSEEKDPQGQTDQAGTERLHVPHPDGLAVVERLRDTHADEMGRAFLLKLDTLIVRLGHRWDAKRDLVFEYLKTGFEQRFQEPDWCIPVNDEAWLAVMPTTGSRKGALSIERLWQELIGFFVGNLGQLPVPLYAVRADDIDGLALSPINLKTWFDREEEEEVSPEASSDNGVTPRMTSIQRPLIVANSLSFAGRNLKVASANETLFELKKMMLIGHRLEPMVMEEADHTLLDRKALTSLDWGLREQVDMMNIEQGLRILRTRTAEQRKMMMVVPAAFSTFASQRARQKITQDVAKAASELGLKVLFEIRELDGVPPHRVLEIVSLIKPFCMTVVGHVSADRKAITALNKCGLSGVCIEYDGVRREDDALNDYLSSLGAVARASVGAFMVQGFESYRQMAVARLAGATHASLRPGAMITPRSEPEQAAV